MSIIQTILLFRGKTKDPVPRDDINLRTEWRAYYSRVSFKRQPRNITVTTLNCAAHC